MSNFSIKEEEAKIVGTATFDKVSDYKAVDLDGNTYLLHKVHADKLISKGLAKLVKDVKIKEKTPEMTSTVIEK
ncbi:hypothetical protein UFOVP299_58 [uncultured Caudovirales phage]|uniref:Uncharacterized protein n=1 Tax=uncultured Caudovirales phage TaxID=2100421 RepID=A0A6J5LP53_9CAUD|nr:hypothetical protein UFOVP299_58 [uncultured Caudovirales phage]